MFFSTFTQFFESSRNSCDALIFDIDGTLSFGKTPLAGAKELLEKLNQENFPYLLLTNDASNSVAQKSGYLQNAGIPVNAEHLLSSGHALKLWAKQNYHGGKFFQLGKFGTPSYVEAAGIEYTTNPDEFKECCGILCGEGVYDWQPSIESAFNLLFQHPEYPLVVCNADSYWASLRFRGMGIGSGAVARFICQVLADAGKQVSPVYLGKPYPMIYQCVAPFLKEKFPERSFNDSSRIIMIGDSLDSDITGANRNGMTSALVLTGITTCNMAISAEGERKPDLIFRSI